MVDGVKQFSVGACVTAAQGKLLCQFSEFHELAEWLLGHPIWTHEFPMYSDAIRQAMLSQHPNLAVHDTSVVNRDNVADFVRGLEEAHGGCTLPVRKGNSTRDQSPIESAEDVFGHDRVVALHISKDGE